MRILALLLTLLAPPALACGADTDCPVAGGDYRIHLPEEATGAIVFAHGYRGSAAGTMGNAALRDLADDLGVALVALNAAGDDWTIANAPQAGRVPERDEIAYVAAVKADAVDRFALDPERMILAGFSAGGMLTWTVACGGGDLFAAFVPMSGTFWAEPPEACNADARITHYHGTADRVVPIGGRAIGPTRQGDLREVIAFYVADRGLPDPEAVAAPDGLTCTRWQGDAMLEYCTHAGGHRFSADWIARAWADTFR